LLLRTIRDELPLAPSVNENDVVGLSVRNPIRRHTMFFLRRILALFGIQHHSFAEPEQYIARECIKQVAQPIKKLPDADAQRRQQRTDAARAQAIATLGPRYVLHPQYKCRAKNYEDFLQQPPGVLNSWRQLNADPKLRTPSLAQDEPKARRSRLKSI
jgi:hypothetical protein